MNPTEFHTLIRFTKSLVEMRRVMLQRTPPGCTRTLDNGLREISKSMQCAMDSGNLTPRQVKQVGRVRNSIAHDLGTTTPPHA